MTLLRVCVSEFVGTAFLVATVVGSGIMATDLTDDVGLQLLINSTATGAVLVALILALQSISAAFNPVVTLVQRVRADIDSVTAAGSIGAQVLGGALGAVLANVMFERPAISIATTQREGSGVWLAEVVATLGLVLVIFALVEAGRGDSIAFGVGGYIAAAYWFTSSTSFANPAVTIARMFSDSFAGIAPGSVAPFVLMQLVGGVAAVGLLRLLHPNPLETR